MTNEVRGVVDKVMKPEIDKLIAKYGKGSSELARAANVVERNHLHGACSSRRSSPRTTGTTPAAV